MDRKIEKKKRRLPVWSWVLVLALSLGILVFYTRSPGKSLRVSRERLNITTVERAPFREEVPILGTVVPLKTHYLDAVEGGRIEKVFLQAGSQVRQGDVILRFVNTGLLMDVMYREAEFIGQSNSLRNTRLNLEEQRLEVANRLLEKAYEISKQQREVDKLMVLHTNGLVSTSDLENAQAELTYLKDHHALIKATGDQRQAFRLTQIEQLEASLERMKTNLSLIKGNLENLVVRAPLDGLLTSLEAEVGQSKTRGERLGRIDFTEGFKIRARVDEHYIGRVAKEQIGNYRLGDQTGKLEIIKIYPEVVEGHFEIDMVFAGVEPTGIRRGQTLSIRLELGEARESMLLANGSFYSRTGGQWVYVLQEDTAVRRDIALGRSNGKQYEVLQGLNPGEQVIISSYESLGDADRLVLK